MAEKNYERAVLPKIRRMEIGDKLVYSIERTDIVRSTINMYKQKNLKQFRTEKIGLDLFVWREADREPVMS